MPNEITAEQKAALIEEGRKKAALEAKTRSEAMRYYGKFRQQRWGRCCSNPPPRPRRRAVVFLYRPATDLMDLVNQVDVDRAAGPRVIAMSASLIGRLGSSTFRLSATAVLMSLTGSRFSSESAPRPFHHGIRGRGGTI
mgnify:CR=1 FL=1